MDQGFSFINKVFGVNIDPTSQRLDKEGPAAKYPEYLRAYLMYLGEPSSVVIPNTQIHCLGRKFASVMAARAAFSSYFGRLKDSFKALEWSWNPSLKLWAGNPALNPIVGDYYKALKRNVSSRGEMPESVKSTTKEDLRILYNQMVNTKDKLQPVRKAFYCYFLFSFLCLLRVNEMLELRIDDTYIRYQTADRVHLRIQPRKTGGKYLYFVFM